MKLSKIKFIKLYYLLILSLVSFNLVVFPQTYDPVLLDPCHGLFIQIIGDPKENLPLPDAPQRDKSSILFGVLIKAQAMGDREALAENDRRVILIDLGNDIKKELELLRSSIL